MKRLFLIVALIVSASAFAFAQTAKDDKTTPHLHPVYMYVYTIMLDFDLQDRGRGNIVPSVIWSGYNKADLLCDENGTTEHFNNMPDLMNYLSRRGWEYVDFNRRDDNIVGYFLFRKMVKSDAEMQKGLYFKSHFENKENKK